MALVDSIIVFLVGLIKSMYERGWMNATAISFTAWISALQILYLLTTAGVGSFDAVGMLGV
jgi:hypothetical protein